MTIKFLLLIQVLVVAGVTVGFALCNWHWGFSALIGAGIAWLGSAYLGLRLYGARRPQPATKVLANFYRGVLGRFLLIVGLLMVVLALAKWNNVVIILGFGITSVINGFVMVMVGNRK